MNKKEALLASARHKLLLTFNDMVRDNPHVNRGQLVAKAWEAFVGAQEENRMLLGNHRQWGTLDDIVRSPVSFWRNEAPPLGYLPTASLQCIHDWERHPNKMLWNCRQCGENVTEFDIHSGRSGAAR